MYFLVYTQDRENSEIIRKANRVDHHTWLRQSTEIVIHMAGPWMDDEERMLGSVMVVEADNKQVVENWLLEDPYRHVDLVASAKVIPFNWAINKPKPPRE